MLTGGAVVPPAAVQRVAAASPDTNVIDGYGPTETTTFASTHLILPEDLHGGGIPIGTSVRGGRLFILDDRMQPVPPGDTGMLYIAGDGLTRGYDELLSSRITSNPVARARLTQRSHAAAVARGLIPPETPAVWGELLLQQLRLAPARGQSHTPDVCRAPILLFRAAGSDLPQAQAAFDWLPFTTGGVTQCMLDREHNTILQPDPAAETAERLRPFLA